MVMLSRMVLVCLSLKGVHPPNPMMHYPFSDFPLLFGIFHSLGKFSQLIPQNYLSSAKISDDLFQSFTLNLECPPIFGKTLQFPPCFGQFFYVSDNFLLPLLS